MTLLPSRNRRPAPGRAPNRPNPFLLAGAAPAAPPAVRGRAAQRGRAAAPLADPAVMARALAGMGDAELQQKAALAQKAGAFWLQLRSVRNPRERLLLLARYAAQLVQQGIYDSLQEVTQEDVSDQGLDRRMAVAMGLTQELERRRRAATARPGARARAD